jgi:hypothetical protein
MSEARCPRAPPARSVDARNTCSATSPADSLRSPIAGGRAGPPQATAAASPSPVSAAGSGRSELPSASTSSSFSHGGGFAPSALGEGRPGSVHPGSSGKHPAPTSPPPTRFGVPSGRPASSSSPPSSSRSGGAHGTCLCSGSPQGEPLQAVPSTSTATEHEWLPVVAAPAARLTPGGHRKGRMERNAR